MAEPQAGAFDRDTAVELERAEGPGRRFAAHVADGWQAGRGPHGGYLAAIILRALERTVEDSARRPRSLTIHYLRAPAPGAVSIATRLEREGSSLSSVSARMEQDGKLMALALAAFSVAWEGPEVSELQMPAVEPPSADRRRGTVIPAEHGGPPFARHITLQPRFGGIPFVGPPRAMESGGWIGLAEPRPLDELALAFFCDALIPAPFYLLRSPAPAPTIDLTVHFRAAPRTRDPHELVLARARASVIHEGFFEEDAMIWARDGTLLAQSRQLALVMS